MVDKPSTDCKENNSILDDPKRIALISQQKKKKKDSKNEEASTILPQSVIGSAKVGRSPVNRSMLSGDYKRIFSSESTLPKLSKVEIRKEYNSRLSARFKKQNKFNSQGSIIPGEQSVDYVAPNIKLRNFLRKKDNDSDMGYYSDRRAMNNDSPLKKLYGRVQQPIIGCSKAANCFSQSSQFELGENCHEGDQQSINETPRQAISNYLGNLIYSCDYEVEKNKGSFTSKKYGPSLAIQEEMDAENQRQKRLKQTNIKYQSSYVYRKKANPCYVDDELDIS